MTSAERTIHQLYTSIANGTISKIDECYAPTVKFYDPIFGSLSNNEVPKMWKMLITRNQGNIKVEYTILKSDDYTASVEWIAKYTFGKNQRKITNVILSQISFKDGLIIKQKDDFNIWTWSKQAFGWSGYLLGWTGYMQQKIQEKALISLKNFIESSSK